MKIPVLLSICGKQAYAGQEPDVIELVTEGYLKQTPEGWDLGYEETDLTGLAGVTTTFHIQDDTVILDRTGKLCSQMVFRRGVPHESLYRMEFGALMISVCATKISVALSPEGGTVDLTYNIDIEKNAAGTVEYHLEVSLLKAD